MIEMIFKDDKHFVDSDAYLRARLFDTLINDWDRHEDQWRWASFKTDTGTVYKPIPRDRDQAFLETEGVISFLTTLKIILPGFQKFDENTKDVEGLAFNARYLDRVLLVDKEWSHWTNQLDTIKMMLTDERIDNATLSFPKEIQSLCSDNTANILKARINNLDLMGRDLYLFLSKQVNITGTNQRDLFEIIVPNDTTIQITGYHLSKKSKRGKEIYKRTFISSETKNVRIYSFDKKDRFVISGKSKNKIKLSIIGGGSKDEIIFNGIKSPTYLTIYDNSKTKLSPNINNRISTTSDNNELEYDRFAFKYNFLFPSLFMGYNQDDGIFWGGGVAFNKYSRYHYQRYEILANYAFLTDSYNFHFTGRNNFPLKNIEINMEADIKSPNFTNNYFGMGNETKLQVGESNIKYYHLRIKEYYLSTGFVKIIDDNKTQKTGLSLFYKNTIIEKTPERFISNYLQNNLDREDLLPRSFAGINLAYSLNTILDNETKKEEEFGGSNMLNTRGFQIDVTVSHFIGLNNKSQNFTKLLGETRSYISFSKRPRAVYAIKIGGEKLIGNYIFTEAAKLGQKNNLRGFHDSRFYGDASIYLNTEVRIRLKQFKTYILNGTMGVFLFNDVGRVWLEDEESSLWHDGYGFGLWWSMFNMTMFTLSYAESKDDSLVNFAFNFQF